MTELTNLQAELLLMTYEEMNNGNVNPEQINLAYNCIPDKNAGLNTLMKVKEIRRFVIFNEEELTNKVNQLNMATTIINNQSDQNVVVEAYALESNVKPKRKYTPRKKTKARRKR